MSATATYTETGEISVTEDGAHIAVGQFDADGGEWTAEVDRQLAEAGFRRVGDWDGDDAQVVRA